MLCFSCSKAGRELASVDSDKRAKVAELADAPDLGSGGETHEGSSPSFRTNNQPHCSFRPVPRIVPTQKETVPIFPPVRAPVRRSVQPVGMRVLLHRLKASSSKRNVQPSDCRAQEEKGACKYETRDREGKALRQMESRESP